MPGGHAKILGLLKLEATLGAGHRLIALILEAFSLYMVVTVARLTA